ncbi:MAG: hypothetical protein ACE5IW_01500 [bacterium]
MLQQGRIISVVILFSLAASTIKSQTKDSFITRLRGGNVKFEIGYASTLVPAQEGNLVSLSHLFTKPFEPFAYHLNPSFLAYTSQAGVSLEFTPGFSLSLNRFVDFNSRVREEIDAAIVDFRSEDFVVSYPQVSGDYLNFGGISSVAVVLPISTEGWTIFGVSQNLLNLRGSYINSGLESQMVSNVDVSEGTQKVIFNGFLDATLDVRATVRGLSAGVAKVMSPEFALAFTINRYQAELRANGFANVDGVMIFGGTEHVFNNPQDPWPNTLRQSAKARYRGNGLGLNLSGTYHLKPNVWVLDAVLELPFTIKMSGQVEQEFNKIPALNLDAVIRGEELDEILDPVKLKLSQLTLTEPDSFETYDALSLSIPKKIKGSLTYLGKRLKTRLTFGKYLSRIQLEYEPNRIGLNSAFFVNAQFEVARFQLSMGLTKIKPFARKTDEEPVGDSNHIIPSFALGANLNLSKNSKIYLILSSTPSPALRSRVTFNF